MRFFYFLLSLMGCSSLFAQNLYTESLAQVEKSGYYRIALSQEMIGLARDHAFNGIRIKDQQGRELAYFIEDQALLKNKVQYDDLKIVNTATDSKNSFVIVENDQQIQSMYVQIKSLDVLGKQAQIRGSHDRKQWYLVQAKLDISKLDQHFNENDEVFELSFPKGNYPYYEIMLFNSQEQPIEIWSVKTKKKLPMVEPEWQLLSLGRLIQRDSSDKKSYISFPDLKNQYVVGKIKMEVISSKNYYRRSNWNGFDFVMSSKNSSTVFTDLLKVKSGDVLVVGNQNNEPLRLGAIQIYGIPVYLCVYLEEKQDISIYLDVNMNEPPNYDIVHFKNDIPKELPVLYASNFKQAISANSEPPAREEKWYESKLLMWSVIVIVGLFLVWMCYRIANDLQKKDLNG